MTLSAETENLITFYTEQNDSLQKQLDQVSIVENGITITTGVATTGPDAGKLTETKIWGSNEILSNYTVPISNLDDKIVAINDEITILRQEIITTYNTAVAYGCSYLGGPGIGSTVTLYEEKAKYKGYKYSGSNPFKNIGGRLRSTTTVGINSTNAVANITDGSISSITIIESESGYLVTPQITISPPTGVGTTATAVANLDNKSIESITITNSGSGYTGLTTTVFIENPGRTTGLGTMSYILELIDDESPIIIGSYYPLTGLCIGLFPGCTNGQCTTYKDQITSLESQIATKIARRTTLINKANKLKNDRIQYELQNYGYRRTRKNLQDNIDKNNNLITWLRQEENQQDFA